MKNIITRSENKQEIPEQKLVRELPENSLEFKELTNEQNRNEIINITAIFLDESLSIDERLRRAGSAPANSPFVKEFKNNFINFAKKNKKLLEELQKQKKETLKGILNLTLDDFTLNPFLNGISKNSVGSALKNNNKQKIVNSNEQTVAKNKEQTNKKEFKIKDIIREDRSANFNRTISKKQSAKTSSKSNLFTELQSVGQTAKKSQVEILEEQRREKALNSKTTSVERTMSTYPQMQSSSR